MSKGPFIGLNLDLSIRHVGSSYQDFGFCGHKVLHKLETCKASEYNEEAVFKTIPALKYIVPLSFLQIDVLRDKIFVPACWQYVL